ncbi:hypothetical protein, partial [Muribaculum intestinale]|uniref:hypothetical protein n=1 Tax=Muribaculum intestinale TaxID=1796646 RepID=UPI0025A97C1E
KIYETKGSFITIQSLACFKANVKIYQQYGTNYITSVIRRQISALTVTFIIKQALKKNSHPFRVYPPFGRHY